MRVGARWMGVLLVGAWVLGGPAMGGEPSGPGVQGYTVPGRNPDSGTPWEFFLGHAAHRLIAYMYGVNHPGKTVYYNTEPIRNILGKSRLGDASRLLPEERDIRPDITDVTDMVLFEIKPGNAQGLQEGRMAVQVYLTALNRTMAPPMGFKGGRDFEGAVLIRFAQGEYIWRLTWWNPDQGLVQYSWTRSQQRFESAAAAFEAGQWVSLTAEELQKYGGWVGQAVEGMVTRRQQLATVSNVIGLVIDISGNAATMFFLKSVLGQMGSNAQRPPNQGGGQVIPFPTQPTTAVPPTQVPAAAMAPSL